MWGRVMRIDVEERTSEAEVGGKCQCGLEGGGAVGGRTNKSYNIM